MVLEAVGLVAWHRRTGSGVAPANLLTNLAAGFCMLGALRLALGGAAWPWIAAALLGSLIAHLLDLQRRWGARDLSRGPALQRRAERGIASDG